MTSQRHQIQRQIIEISVADPETGQRLHDELSRLQREVIEPLLDKCCSELSSADRVHRIPRIEIDLGHITLENLQQEWVEKFEVALRDTLAAKILEEEQISVMIGEDPAVAAQAELISLFARTGSVPFWVDSSSSGAVDAAVQRLLGRDVPLLSRLILELSREPRAIRRLVRHVKPERLRALLEALLRAPPLVAAELAGAVWELLALNSATSPMTPPVVWGAALETSLLVEIADASSRIEFFRELLGRVALETGLAYAPMVQDLLEQSRGRGVGKVLATLAAEVSRSADEKVPGTFEESDAAHVAKVPAHVAKVPTIFGKADAPGASILDAPGTPNSPHTAAQTAGSPQSHKVPTTFGESEAAHKGPKVPTTFLTNMSGSPLSTERSAVGEGGWGGEAHKVPGTFGESETAHKDPKVPTTFLTNMSGSPLSTERSAVGEGGWGGEAHKVPTTFGKADAPRGSILDAPGALNLPPTAAQTAGPPESTETPGLDKSNKVLGTLGAGADDAKPLGTPSVGKLERFQTTSDPARRGSQEVSNRFGGAPEEGSGGSQLSGPPTGGIAEVSKRLESAQERHPSGLGAREPLLTPFKVPTPLSRPQMLAKQDARASRLHEEPEQIYLDVAGLVLIWPFLPTFFERLELLVEKKSFRDEGARARAVLLLHYVATGEIDPPEYRLPLAKVLCGMPFDALFVPGPEMTEKEMAEGTRLLSAVLEHAKIFGHVSNDDFRAAFLVRRGVLATRDGSWLLRVESAPYDLILQQLPWPLSWIRLPWMQIPVFVEWIR